ncbi:hypothetical protein P7C70_g7025, partial [Phenoliferia sp. Uapishka_3]
MSDPNRSFQTPLLHSRTLHSAAATIGSSRLPLRRGSVTQAGKPPYAMSEPRSKINDVFAHIDAPHQAAGVTMTAGRARGPLMSSAAAGGTSSRVPMSIRKPSVSDASRSDSSQSSLKRSSSSAGLSSGPFAHSSVPTGQLTRAHPNPTDAQLSTAKRALSTTQHELSELQHTHSRHLLESETLTASLQSQLDEYIKRTERLERSRLSTLSKERENEVREKAIREELEKEKAELKAQDKKLRLELAELRDQHASLGDNFRDLEHEVGQTGEALERECGRARGLEMELERARKEERERSVELGKEKERRRVVEEELEVLRGTVGDSKNAEVVKEELHRQVSHLRALEKENGKLVRRLETFEKQHSNYEVLKESNKALEKKARGVDALRQQAVTLEAEVEAMKREKREWQSFLGSEQGTEFSSPRKLTKTLAATRIENASFREKLDMLELEIHHRDRMIGELEERVVALEKSLVETTAKLSKSEAKAGQEGNRQKLAVQEIEMLKRHLATYATEEAAPDKAGSFDVQKTARIEELEHLLEAHKSEVSKLAKDVAHYQGLVERYGGSTTEIHDIDENGHRTVDEDDTGVIVSRTLQSELAKNEALQAELDELRNTTALMEKEIDSLDFQVGRLQYENGLGAYNPLTTKILELRDNPDLEEHAIRTSTLERLREENEALLVSMALLEEKKGVEKRESMVPRQSLVNARKEVEAAEAVVKQKETMELRLKKAFSDKADEFRKAVQSLLGFRLDFLSSGRVKVTSVYNPGKEYALLFSSAAGGVGTMELLGAANDKDEMGDEVKEMVKFWGAKGCIPGLLASLSLTLFDKTQ